MFSHNPPLFLLEVKEQLMGVDSLLPSLSGNGTQVLSIGSRRLHLTNTLLRTRDPPTSVSFSKSNRSAPPQPAPTVSNKACLVHYLPVTLEAGLLYLNSTLCSLVFSSTFISKSFKTPFSMSFSCITSTRRLSHKNSEFQANVR